MTLGCGTRVAGSLLAVLLLASPVLAEGWRPEVRSETDAEWLTRLDTRLSPVHATMRDTIEIAGSASSIEQDAYLTILQSQAAKGLTILDSMEPAPWCAIDYAATERVMFLLWGDVVDGIRQFRAGSAQAAAEINVLGPAADLLLKSYADTIRQGACEPEPTPEPSQAPRRTPTPMSTGG